MKIKLHYSTRIGTIKKAFNQRFPYLKLEFLATAYAKCEMASWVDMFIHNMYVGEINKKLREGSINISEDYKVASVEQLFQQHFELSVMVFRKQKKGWVKADNQGAFTLLQQNQIGKENCFHSYCAL